jgi:hypothetical protein
MTSKEFIMWMKGFTEAVHELGPSPANWQLIKDALAKVEDKNECKCTCSGKTYSYPYNFYTGTTSTGTVVNDRLTKEQLND